MNFESININSVKSGQLADKAQNERVIKKADTLKNFKSTELEDKKKDIEQVARGFESIFVNMMMKNMRKAMLEEKDDNGFGSNTMMEMANMELADKVSNSGKGIGLAEMIYKNMTGETIPNKINISSPNNFNKTEVSESTLKRIENYSELIDQASKEYGIPKTLIKSVIAAESAGKEDAVSSAGAKGLMQLMDATAMDLEVNDSFDPEQNIYGGTKYLNQMLNQFDGSLELALAAYNAGPGNVEKYNGIPPFSETQSYVNRVIGYNNYIKNR